MSEMNLVIVLPPFSESYSLPSFSVRKIRKAAPDLPLGPGQGRDSTHPQRKSQLGATEPNSYDEGVSEMTVVQIPFQW